MDISGNSAEGLVCNENYSAAICGVADSKLEEERRLAPVCEHNIVKLDPYTCTGTTLQGTIFQNIVNFMENIMQ